MALQALWSGRATANLNTRHTWPCEKGPLRVVWVLMLILGITCLTAHAADDGAAEAKRQAQTCADALAQHDYDTFASMLYPKLLQWIGGRNALIQKLQKSDQEMASQGISMQSVVMGEVTQIRIAKGETFAVVPQTIEMATREGIVRSNSYLLGISSDDGKTWHFIDGAGVAGLGKEIYILLPNLPADMPLTQAKEPKPAPKKPGPAISGKGKADADAVIIDRAFYTATMPKGSTVDPPSPNVDADHYALVNLPNENTLLILVIDDKKHLQEDFNDYIGTLRPKLRRMSISPSDLFKGRGGKGSIVSGSLEGMPYSFEVGMFSSTKKGFILVCTYEPARRDETRQIFRQVIDSFAVKD